MSEVSRERADIEKFKNSEKHKKNLQDFERYEVKISKLLNYPSNKDWAICKIDTEQGRITAKRFNITNTYLTKVNDKSVLGCTIEIPDFVEALDYGCIGTQLSELLCYENIHYLKVVCTGKNLINTWQSFRRCMYIEYMDFQEFDMSNVEDAQSMFEYCESLEKIKFKTQDWVKLNQSVRMFKDCIKLQGTQSLQNIQMPNVSDISHMFQGCLNLTDASLDFLKSGNNLRKMRQTFKNTAIAEMSLGNMHPKEPVNMEKCFEGCEKLKIADLSQKSNCSIKVNNIDSMFRYCNVLSDVDIQGLDFSSLTKIQQVFEECSGLKEIGLVEKDLSRVTEVKDNFKGCVYLREIKLINCNFKRLALIKNNIPDSWNFHTVDITGTDLQQFLCSNNIDIDSTKLVEYGLYNHSVSIVSGDTKFRLRIAYSTKTIYGTDKSKRNMLNIKQTKLHTQRVYIEYI